MAEFADELFEWSDSPEAGRREAVQCFQEAYKLQMAGALDEAIELYQRSIDLYPTAEAHTFLGWTYSFKGDLGRAIEECHKAIAVDPDFGNPYNDIGAYLIQRDDWLSAIPWLKKAMVAKRYECYFYPHYNYGRILERQGRWLEALREYQAALDYNPDYALALKSLRRLQGKVN